MGQNPYLPETLLNLAEYTIYGPFAYPPLTLHLFQAFGILPLPAAAKVYLALKFVALLWLIVAWRSMSNPNPRPIFLLLLVMFGFEGAVLADLRVGNISLFEQAALWLAFIIWTRSQLLPFCALILFTALFKLTPILFLGLLLINVTRIRIYYFIGSILLFMLLQLVSYIVYPEWTLQFLDIARYLDERGAINPASLALIRDMGDWFVISTPMVNGIFILWVLVVSVVSAYAIKVMPESERQRMGLFLFCLAYALILPRFKDYAYILLIAPVYYVAMIHTSRLTYAFTSIIILIGIISFIFPPLRFDYSSLGIAFTGWLLAVQFALKNNKGKVQATIIDC